MEIRSQFVQSNRLQNFSWAPDPFATRGHLQSLGASDSWLSRWVQPYIRCEIPGQKPRRSYSFKAKHRMNINNIMNCALHNRSRAGELNIDILLLSIKRYAALVIK